MKLEDRKHPRLKTYDYSRAGYYYVTIHNEKGAPVLSWIRQEHALKQPATVLSPQGILAKRHLFKLEERYSYVKLDKYVVMPTHIHAIIQLLPGETPRAGLIQIVQAYKSLVTRACNQRFQTPGKKQFQTSFYESVLRNEQAYRECWKYIDENPVKWLLKPEDL